MTYFFLLQIIVSSFIFLNTQVVVFSPFVLVAHFNLKLVLTLISEAGGQEIFEDKTICDVINLILSRIIS